MATTTTITEALASLHTIDKRLQKKLEFLGMNLMRPENLRDPFDKDGMTQAQAVSRELQSFLDLCDQELKVRSSIRESNNITQVTVNGHTRTVSDWIVWKRETAPRLQRLYGSMVNEIGRFRKEAQSKGRRLTQAGDEVKDQDILVNVSEIDLAKWVEDLEITLGELDGKLSLVNATTTVEVPD